MLSALAGAIVGGAIAEIRTQLQGRRERRQALRRLLFQLLELRYRTIGSNPEKILGELRSYIHGRFGEALSHHLDEPGLQETIRQLLKGLSSSFISPPFDDSYEEAVAAIAPFSPFLAYKLRGLGSLTKLDSMIAGYYKRAMQVPALATYPSASAFRSTMERATFDAAHGAAVGDLANRIMSVAGTLGPLSYLSARRILERQAESLTQDTRDKLDQFVDGVLKSATT